MSALSFFAVALGGALGALSRTGLTEVFGGDLLDPRTLAITLIINVLGAALLALLRRYSHRGIPPVVIDAVGIGFLGAFTTWSAVMATTALAYGAGDTLIAAGYLVASVGMGVVVAWGVRGPIAGARS